MMRVKFEEKKSYLEVNSITKLNWKIDISKTDIYLAFRKKLELEFQSKKQEKYLETCLEFSFRNGMSFVKIFRLARR